MNSSSAFLLVLHLGAPRWIGRRAFRHFPLAFPCMLRWEGKRRRTVVSYLPGAVVISFLLITAASQAIPLLLFVMPGL